MGTGVSRFFQRRLRLKMAYSLRDTLRSPRLLLPEFLFWNYEIEVVGTITDAAEQTRWSSIMYRSQNSNVSANVYKKGSNCQQWYYVKHGGWTVHKLRHIKAYLPTRCTFKVHAEGPEINYYINSEKVLSGKLEGYIKGGTGTTTSTFKIDSLG